MRAVDLLISLPPILFGLLILAVTPPTLWKTIVTVGMVYVPIMTRLTRSVALGLLEEDFVEAARARAEGARPSWRARSCPMPGRRSSWKRPARDVRGPAGFRAVLPWAGAQPPSSEWGLMIAESRQFIDQAPWIGLAPGLCLCALLVAVNLFGEGLRERLDPQLRGRSDG